MSEEKKNIWRVLAHPKALNALAVGFMVALGVLYIGQVNASATKALAVRQLEDRNVMLRVEMQRLDAKIDKLRSLDSVMQRQQFLGLVPAASVEYVTVTSGAVALR